MKNNFLLQILTSVILVSLLLLVIYQDSPYIFVNKDLQYSQEYVPGTGNIKGNVDVDYFKKLGPNYEIGANKYGYAVFKNPKKAFNQLKKDYKQGLNLIKNEYNLKPISIKNYNSYLNYGWQVTTGDTIEQEQARFVTQFLDIYENSYKKG